MAPRQPTPSAPTAPASNDVPPAPLPPAPRWALCTTSDIPDLADPTQTYLRRFRLLETPWFGVFLHKILLPDGDRDLHDHPWHFATLILRGGYREQVPAAAAPRPGSPAGSTPAERGQPVDAAVRERSWAAGSAHVVRATDCHSVRELFRVPTWTLVLIGRRRREWGFRTGAGWVPADSYERYLSQET